MTSRMLTSTLKQKYLPEIISRDNFRCFYCKSELQGNNYVFEHLNNNRTDNRIENIVLSHQSCNVKKSENIEYRMMAEEKLKQNEEMYLSERNFTDSLTDHHSSSEIGINIKTYDITQQYLLEHITTDGYILFEDALWSIVYLSKEKTDYGSHQAVRSHIKTLTSPVGPYEMKRNENNKKIIVKKEGK